MKKISEYQLHVLFWDWCCMNRLDECLFAVEHGEVRDPRVGAKLKRKGVKGGMADYLFMRPNSIFGCLWIEIKVGNNKQTAKQKYFEEICFGCGMDYKVCHTLEELMNTIKNYNLG